MAKALNRFTKEDPTFRTHVDPESHETIIQGMGELHLDVYVERMKREYDAEVETGKPQVAYREAITRQAEFDYTHKKQTGGAGQYGRVIGFIEPLTRKATTSSSTSVKGGRIPREFIPSCDKGFQAAVKKGDLIGFPVIGVRVVLNDGQYHDVDSSDHAFQAAAIGAFRQVYRKAKPQILEPIMKVSVEGPSEFAGNIFGTINQRRGDHRQLGRGRELLPGRRRGAAERDVRLLDAAPLADPGQGRVHHGVPQVRPGPGRASPRRSSAEHAARKTRDKRR